MKKLANEIHALNATWWYDREGNRLVRNKGELLMLVVSELAEGMEGLRKNKMDDHLPHRRMIEVELADAKIRLLDYIAGNDYTYLFDDNTTPAPINFQGLTNEAEALYKLVVVVARIGLFPAFAVCAIQSVDRYAERFGYDVDGALQEKLVYNTTRADHKREAREAVGGKSF